MKFALAYLYEHQRPKITKVKRDGYMVKEYSGDILFAEYDTRFVSCRFYEKILGLEIVDERSKEAAFERFNTSFPFNILQVVITKV